MDDAMREKNEPDVIARRREVYNVLKEQLGPDHIGTVKAGFELAKALIDSSSSVEEPLALLREVSGWLDEHDDEALDEFRDLDFYATCAIYPVLDSAEFADMAIEKISRRKWDHELKEPDDRLFEYSSLNDMLTESLLDSGRVQEALYFQREYLLNILKVYSPSCYACEDAFESLCISTDQEGSADDRNMLDDIAEVVLDDLSVTINDELEDLPEHFPQEINLMKIDDDMAKLFEIYNCCRSLIVYILNYSDFNPSYIVKDEVRSQLRALTDEQITLLDMMSDAMARLSQTIGETKENVKELLDEEFFEFFDAFSGAGREAESLSVVSECENMCLDLKARIMDLQQSLDDDSLEPAEILETHSLLLRGYEAEEDDYEYED